MSSISKIIGSCAIGRSLFTRFSLLNLKVEKSQNILRNFIPLIFNHPKHLCTTLPKQDLMEFFDDKNNWNKNEIKVGRAWNTDELRIKSNTDLHKLWYILLKEKNMLLTMQHEFNDKMEYFPSPERLDKVEISMKNLERVVRERNRAYYLLETGETGERPGKIVRNELGLKHYQKACEHVLPIFMNLKWYKSRNFTHDSSQVRKFLRLYREKLWNEKRKARNRQTNHITKLLRRQPDVDIAELKNKYPNVDIDKLNAKDKLRGHFVPKIES